SFRDKKTRANSPSGSFPGRLAASPQRFKVMLVSHSVHWVPESSMAIRHQLASGSQGFQRLALQRSLIVTYIIQHLGFEDEKAAVDPALAGLWFFHKIHDVINLKFKTATTHAGRNCGNERIRCVRATQDI